MLNQYSTIINVVHQIPHNLCAYWAFIHQSLYNLCELIILYYLIISLD